MLDMLEKWTQYDGDFDHKGLYNDNIVALFESKLDHPWVHEIYAWLDKYVIHYSDHVVADVNDSSRLVPVLRHHLKKQKKVVEEDE